MQVLVVRTEAGEVVARIDPQASNAGERLKYLAQHYGKIRSDLEEDPDFFDLVGMGLR